MELSNIENYSIDMIGTFCCPYEKRGLEGKTCEDCPYYKGLIITEARRVEIICVYYTTHDRHEKAEG